MAKTKTQYACSDCGAVSLKWAGKCEDCGGWNTLTEVVITQNRAGDARLGYAGSAQSTSKLLTEIEHKQTPRFATKIAELDRVLGGGLVTGAVILIGGDPGIGKSTLLLQTVCHLSNEKKVLYVTGEESLEQVSLRAQRLKLDGSKVNVLAETAIETILNLSDKLKPDVLVIDSIQTIYTTLLQSAPGSVSQVREASARLVQYAKTSNVSIFLVGHVTKEGALAGPRVLEHMVDTVLYFEGEKDSRFRAIRAVKNRFGAVGELGVFAMTETGLREVNNPSAIFISQNTSTPGSVVMVTWEGTRPLLVEIQALVDDSHMPNPRRVAIGIDSNRLTLVLAVISRHLGVSTANKDIFVNVVGGIKISETAADLALIFAIMSSLKDFSIDKETVIFGEMGLTGEIRPVHRGQDRLKEAAKLGYKKAIIPKANLGGHKALPLEVQSVEVISDLQKYF